MEKSVRNHTIVLYRIRTKKGFMYCKNRYEYLIKTKLENMMIKVIYIYIKNLKKITNSNLI